MPQTMFWFKGRFSRTMFLDKAMLTESDVQRWTMMQRNPVFPSLCWPARGEWARHDELEVRGLRVLYTRHSKMQPLDAISGTLRMLPITSRAGAHRSGPYQDRTSSASSGRLHDFGGVRETDDRAQCLQSLARAEQAKQTKSEARPGTKTEVDNEIRCLAETTTVSTATLPELDKQRESGSLMSLISARGAPALPA